VNRTGINLNSVTANRDANQTTKSLTLVFSSDVGSIPTGSINFSNNPTFTVDYSKITHNGGTYTVPITNVTGPWTGNVSSINASDYYQYTIKSSNFSVVYHLNLSSVEVVGESGKTPTDIRLTFSESLGNTLPADCISLSNNPTFDLDYGNITKSGNTYTIPIINCFSDWSGELTALTISGYEISIPSNSISVNHCFNMEPIYTYSGEATGIEINDLMHLERQSFTLEMYMEQSPLGSSSGVPVLQNRESHSPPSRSDSTPSPRHSPQFRYSRLV